MRIPLRAGWRNHAILQSGAGDAVGFLKLTAGWGRTSGRVILLFLFSISLPDRVTAASAPDPKEPLVTPAEPKTKPIIAPYLALKLALNRLKIEAKNFQSTGQLEVLKPEFADRFEHELQPADVINAVLMVQDPNNVVIDGYIRWQLLSFKPDLSAVPNAEFQKFVRQLPGFIKHPAMAETLHAEFEQWAKFTGQSVEMRQHLEQKWEALRMQIRQFDVLTLPAVKFRDAVSKLLPATGMQRPIFFLYDVRDRVRAGLSTRSVKSRLTRELKRRRLDETLSADQRWEMIQQIEALAENNALNETRIIREITFYATAPASIRYSVRTISATDVRNWTAYLNRIEP